MSSTGIYGIGMSGLTAAQAGLLEEPVGEIPDGGHHLLRLR